ncbi:G_PROTEIN_RECEP_F1_2 domain-containing protein [Caenorhabditis elegans]|uniref:G_PROTEIN_RECEP_F1_2 domain-containing protein n=1 Tax=Caenorhabditis elegans TaxID=6239 RepID=Q86DA9_CAEEL|nr:G_PROTEIN_RECEP_F1_2 domain-containing protein [Caenorhabditis elegans]CAD89752.2 G_PROTEIN_RECEP_F1_2 domain-containing protein [Caenorhabditis elegans]|eukprot:NP_001024288.2 Uncharacterized protein CELE_Y75B12B.10 [Caenorhabditis elegans]
MNDSYDNNNITIDLNFDVEYAIKYPNLIIVMLGMLSNILHFLILRGNILKHNPTFIMIKVVCIGDFSQLFLSFISEMNAIITYLDHKNCIGYTSIFDLVFKLATVLLNETWLMIAAWTTLFLGLSQIQAIRKSKEWTLRRVNQICNTIISTSFIFVTLNYTMMIILFFQLPSQICNMDNLAQRYLANNSNWIKYTLYAFQSFDAIFNILKLISYIIIPFFLWKLLNGKKVDKKKNISTKYIVYLLFSFSVGEILYFLARFLMLRNDPDNPNIATQKSTILPLELGRMIRSTSACLRPFICLWKSPEYQRAVKLNFALSTRNQQSTVLATQNYSNSRSSSNTT